MYLKKKKIKSQILYKSIMLLTTVTPRDFYGKLCVLHLHFSQEIHT